MESFNDSTDFISHKKVLLFGAESTGKSSFTKRLTVDKFSDKILHTKEG